MSVYSDNEKVDTKEVFLNEEEYDKFNLSNKIEWYYLYPERARSNNSVVLERKNIEKDVFESQWSILENSGSGEPGFYLTNCY